MDKSASRNNSVKMLREFPAICNPLQIAQFFGVFFYEPPKEININFFLAFFAFYIFTRQCQHIAHYIDERKDGWMDISLYVI